METYPGDNYNTLRTDAHVVLGTHHSERRQQKLTESGIRGTYRMDYHCRLAAHVLPTHLQAVEDRPVADHVNGARYKGKQGSDVPGRSLRHVFGEAGCWVRWRPATARGVREEVSVPTRKTQRDGMARCRCTGRGCVPGQSACIRELNAEDGGDVPAHASGRGR